VFKGTSTEKCALQVGRKVGKAIRHIPLQTSSTLSQLIAHRKSARRMGLSAHKLTNETNFDSASYGGRTGRDSLFQSARLTHPGSILLFLLIVSHSYAKWTCKTSRRYVHCRDQRMSNTASTVCKPRHFPCLSHSFCQGLDLPCSIMRKRRRLQGHPQCLHKAGESHPGFHGYCRIQGRDSSRKASCVMEGAHRLPASK
jgi:hypothetical protein